MYTTALAPLLLLLTVPANAASIPAKRAAPAVPAVGTISNGWASMGCWQDYDPHLVWAGWDNFQQDSTVSNTECQNRCAQGGFGYAANSIGYSLSVSQCFCSNTINYSAGGARVDSTLCDTPCAADKTQNCGSYWKIVMFRTAALENAAKAAAAASSSSSISSASASASAYSSSVSAYSASLSTSASVASSVAASLSASASAFSASSLSVSASVASSLAASLSASASVYSATSLAASASLAQSVAASLSSSASIFTATSMAASASAASSLASSLSASASAAAAAATVVPTPWVAASSACIAEGTTGRALTGAELVTDDMTYPKCLNFCSSKGFNIGSITYSRECRCGNQLVNGASLSKVSTNCGMPCSGSKATVCGGPNALTLFVVPAGISGLASDLTAKTAALASGWVAAPTACIAEGKTGRALPLNSFADDKMTPAMCTAWCTTQNAAVCGLEYGRECWAGLALSNGADMSISSNACDMPCAGDSNSLCGGPGALTLFVNPSYKAPVVAAPVKPAYPTTLPSGWNAASTQCIQEVNGRALTGASTTDSAMTVPKCLAFCQSKGFQYAGLEYGVGGECYCSSMLNNGASLSSASSNCNMACNGDATSLCGGPAALQLYVNPSLAPKTTMGSFTAAGCIQEVPNRALTGASTATSDMTVEKCGAFCQSKGFSKFGLEYSQECYCGNDFSNGAALSKTSNQCNMPCAGSPSSQICGGSNAISLWMIGSA